LNQVYSSLYTAIIQFAPSAKITDSLDMIGFRNSVNKFKWPGVKNNRNQSNSNRFVNTSTLKTQIIDALNLNNPNALNNLPSLSGSKFDLLNPDALAALQSDIVNILNLNQSSGLKVDFAQALQLTPSDALKLNNVSLLSSNTVEVTNARVMNDLRIQVADALGLSDRSSIIVQLSSFLNLNADDCSALGLLPSLSSSSLNIFDSNFSNNVQKDVIKFLSDTNRIKQNIIKALELNVANQNLLNHTQME
jgi:hypothetical protein